MENIVKLTVAPKIETNIEAAAKEIDKLIDSLEIDKMVATEATKKSLKETNSKLSRLELTYEESRKALKTSLLESYDEMMPTYKEKILEKIKIAKDKLSKKIIFVEDAQRKKKRDSLESLFMEHCSFHDIDFVEFEDVGLKINISASDKKLAEQLNEYFFKMGEEIATIEALANSDDVMVEYRKNKNFALSVKIVQDREAQKKVVEQKKADIKIPTHVKVKEVKAVKTEKVGMVRLFVKTTPTKWGGLKDYMKANGIEFGQL